MRLMINDWAWSNSVMANAPVSAVLPWGYAITFEDGLVACYRTLKCVKVRETEKAVQVEYKAPVFGRNCDLTGKVLTWKVWLPKSCIKDYFESDSDLWYNGGQYDLVEARLARLAKEGWKAKYSSITKDTLIPIVKTK